LQIEKNYKNQFKINKILKDEIKKYKKKKWKMELKKNYFALLLNPI
jgi:hypothetical protein